MAFLSTILANQQKAQSSFLLLQSSAAQSALPVLRSIVDVHPNYELVLLCALYAPTNLVGRNHNNPNIRVLDWTLEIPGFQDEPIDWKDRIAAVESAIKESTSPVIVAIDSVDTLDEDLQSPSETYRLLFRILSFIRLRKGEHPQRSPIAMSLISILQMHPACFCPSLTHLTAHPPALLTHIAAAYLTPPPSAAADASAPETLKFWRVFIPLAERALSLERLVFGEDGAGGAGGGPSDELLVEVVVRGKAGDAPISSAGPSSAAKRRGVYRVLEGWCKAKGGPTALEGLHSLKRAWRKQTIEEQDSPDPTKNLTFNLSLTNSQQTSRSKVPLPYEHKGRLSGPNQGAQIFYDPDSADDLDDEDPDEDLDI